jgi:hypothetical protein
LWQSRDTADEEIIAWLATNGAHRAKSREESGEDAEATGQRSVGGEHFDRGRLGLDMERCDPKRETRIYPIGGAIFFIGLAIRYIPTFAD